MIKRGFCQKCPNLCILVPLRVWNLAVPQRKQYPPVFSLRLTLLDCICYTSQVARNFVTRAIRPINLFLIALIRNELNVAHQVNSLQRVSRGDYT